MSSPPCRRISLSRPEMSRVQFSLVPSGPAVTSGRLAGQRSMDVPERHGGALLQEGIARFV
ncbi:MAG TPA: hypothetical protein PLU54_08150, partial [Deltaproteobacteria bacterium]|nr:hypothetical protein [Deltaproteobacteria bacterium]